MIHFVTFARLPAAIAVAGLALAPAPANANDNRDVSDLIGERASSGESALRQRGYSHVSTHAERDALHAYWWNQSRNNCVRVETYDGRYRDIAAASDGDCNHDDKGISTGGAVAIGAAALIGGLLLAHKSHDHDERKHSDDSKYEAEYDRGYADGLHNFAYHNYDRSDAYSSGYTAGAEEREERGSHRRDHHAGAGYRPSVDVSDLNGARAAGAEQELQRRGFTNVDGFKSGTTAYTIWYSDRTGQCLQNTVADGRVYDIRDIGQHPKCR